MTGKTWVFSCLHHLCTEDLDMTSEAFWVLEQDFYLLNNSTWAMSKCFILCITEMWEKQTLASHVKLGHCSWYAVSLARCEYCSKLEWNRFQSLGTWKAYGNISTSRWSWQVPRITECSELCEIMVNINMMIKLVEKTWIYIVYTYYCGLKS